MLAGHSRFLQLGSPRRYLSCISAMLAAPAKEYHKLRLPQWGHCFGL
jgi:hypothetical protein